LGNAQFVCGFVIKINPNTLKVEDLIRYPYNDTFNFSTVAIRLGKELWVGYRPSADLSNGGPRAPT
jgi:hypothetical protein